jgi:hypothetical protein
MDWMYVVCFIAGIVWYKAFIDVFGKRRQNTKDGTHSTSHKDEGANR